MEKNKTLATIKKDIESHVGEKVTLKANGGRPKILAVGTAARHTTLYGGCP